MFNLTTILKNCLDSKNSIDCIFSECSRFIRNILSGYIKRNSMNIEIENLKKYKYTRKYKKTTIRYIKAGSYKSVNTLNIINKEYIDNYG
jgi:hypothetical protein